MQIIISNIIEIKNPTKEMTSFVKKKLTYKNPDYVKRRNMGYFRYGIARDIKLYNEYCGSLYTPIGFFDELWKFHPVPVDYTDFSVTRPIVIESDIKLRDYQQPVIRAVREHLTGLIIAPCGLGKTSMGLQVIAELKQKTLWLTHSGELLQQAKDRAESSMTCTTSTITEGKCDTSGDIVFATIQTVVKYIEKDGLKQDIFGMVVGDEIHRCCANPSTMQMFRQCIEFFNARYRIGLTATLHRADGLEDCIKHIIGNVIYNIEKKGSDYVCIYNNEEILRFPLAQFQVPARVKMFTTDYAIDDKPIFSENGGTIVYASLITDIAMNKKRNSQLLNTLNSIEGSTIVLSDRVEQLKYLCDNVYNGVQIDGSTPKKHRQKALDDVRKGKIKYLFASYTLCKEGLDLPILSNLVMATPVKDFSIVVQSIGRIQRPYEGKKVATVYDFVDVNVGMLTGFYSKRRSTYKKNNWDIENIYLSK